MTFDPASFARNYTRLLYDFARTKSDWADFYYSLCMSDENAYSQVFWVKWASACDNLVDEVEDLIWSAEQAAEEKLEAA